MRIRHVACVVSDVGSTARLHEEVFGLRRLGSRNPKNFDGRAEDLSDGEVNFALLGPSPERLNASAPTDDLLRLGPLHVGIGTDDPERVLASLGERGIDTYAQQGAGPDFFKFRDHDKIEYDVISDPGLAPTGRERSNEDWHGIRHVAYVVADLERAAQFYCDTFGFVRLPDRDPLNFDGKVVDLTDGEVHFGLVCPRPGTVTPVLREENDAGLMHIGIAVDDVAATLNALSTAGIRPYAIDGDPGNPSFFKIRDFDGIEVDIAAGPGVFPV